MSAVDAVLRGAQDPFRARARGVIVVLLLALVMTFLALMLQAALSSRGRIAELEARVRTLIELREAGAFGTGGFGGDKPVGEEHFSIETLGKVRRIPNAQHLARVDEYVYRPHIDPSKPNAYAMLIGVPPGAALRAIGEIDYESARIIAGRSFLSGEAAARVAVVGRLYARQRLGLADPAREPLAGRELVLDGQAFEVIGIYSTENDFGDNHVFLPLEAFRAAFKPGGKLSKIFVTVDSVANVERVVSDLKNLTEADVVTTPEAVSTARTTLAGLAQASAYGAALLFAIGAALAVFVMILSMRERVSEIGTLKAIGASSRDVALQFAAEAAALCGLGALGASILVAPAGWLLRQVLAVPVAVDAQTIAFVVLCALVFAGLGSLYPVAVAARLSPVEAMRSNA